MISALLLVFLLTPVSAPDTQDLTPPADAAPAESAPAAADSRWQALRERYLGLKSLSGSFEQTVRATDGLSPEGSWENGTGQFFTGRFWSVLPDRYRLEVASPERQVIVANDTALWFHFPGEARAIREARPRVMPLLAFLDPVLDASTSARLDTAPDGTPLAFIAPADEMSALQDLRLELSADWQRIEAFEFSDPWGNEYRFVLKSQLWNPELPASLFQFRPPPGTVVE